MILNNNKVKKDPPTKEINFILELLNSNKFSDAESEIYKQVVKYPNSSILYNMLGAILAGKNKLDEAIKGAKLKEFDKWFNKLLKKNGTTKY